MRPPVRWHVSTGFDARLARHIGGKSHSCLPPPSVRHGVTCVASGGSFSRTQAARDCKRASQIVLCCAPSSRKGGRAFGLRRPASQLIVSLFTVTALARCLLPLLPRLSQAAIPSARRSTALAVAHSISWCTSRLERQSRRGLVGYVDRATGTYEIENLPPGAYFVTFSAVHGGSNLGHRYLTQYRPGPYREGDATSSPSQRRTRR